MNKAYLVREKDELIVCVIFAETAGKAKSYALCCEEFEDAEYINLEVTRIKEMDKYATQGKIKMEWENPSDRIILVRDCGFTCFEPTKFECEVCSAKNYCDIWGEGV